MASRPKVLLVCDRNVRDTYMTTPDLERLDSFADWEWLEGESEIPFFSPSEDADLIARLHDAVTDADAVAVCCGSPRIDEKAMERAAKLRFIGEIAGDRFSERVDVEAAWQRGIRTVDTTNGTSYPVAEWALALIIISLRRS